MSFHAAMTGAIVRANDLIVVPVGDEFAMFSPRTGQYFRLNATATHIWRIIDGPHTIREICQTLLDVYDVDADTCESEVTALVRELVEQGLADEAQN